MISDAYSWTKDNVATIQLPPKVLITITAKTNSAVTQKITFNKNNQEFSTFTGSGEHNTVIGQSTATFDSEIQVKFEYSSGEQWLKSKLNSGGPYEIGSYNMLAIVAENGDDSDYNDSILEFSWHTPRN